MIPGELEVCIFEKGRPHRGSNTGQHDLQSYALTTELWSLSNSISRNIFTLTLIAKYIGGVVLEPVGFLES